ncbi:hypothetical protein HPP92_017081 [Vanilla planifolia]|uniref:Outer envelope protein 61 n=1 Tax=Vanilla planifolia TaxID=51239 RepID=A0A835UN91_VANPL|nr:hypothetical protein HPP92_017081 [Vanilla planifolia]
MMDPELMRVAQEQLSKIPPQELAKIQQQMFSNPEFMKLASENLQNLRPEDVKRATEELKHVKTEDMAELTKKMANASPEELAYLKAHADARISYQISAAEMLKKQGNELHGQGNYQDATKKYLLAKDNLKGIPSIKSSTLQLQCSLNLMSCFLKTMQFEDCISEGTEVLKYDPKNVKAFYRRGVIENIEEKEAWSIASESCSSIENPLSEPVEGDKSFRNVGMSSEGDAAINPQSFRPFMDDPETVRLFQRYVSQAGPDSLGAMGLGGMSPDVVKMATEMISSMSPEELQKMFEVANSLKGNDSGLPNMNGNKMTPELMRMASEKISKLPPEMLNKMHEFSSSLKTNGSSVPSDLGKLKCESDRHSSAPGHHEADVGSTSFLSSTSPQSHNPPASTDLQETMRNSMKDPAMRQMFTSMMKSMSPDMMANMSEQFGMKLSKEDAAKAQQAMASLSPDDLDRMMRWAEKAQRGVDTVKKTKNWLLGRPGMILGIVMLIIAVILHQLGFIGS